LPNIWNILLQDCISSAGFGNWMADLPDC